ncbi:hypothetical protein [uncultured Psychrobacter sp.]|uniref:hypothetical protein n=1 Tax=uncultured Psychrobacter sp. TaxID=259303 RepID=UPI003459DCFC
MLIGDLSKPFVSCLVLPICSLLIVGISGCFKTPHPSSAIEGDIEISTNDKGGLCFEPLFATTVLHDQPIQIKYIKMSSLEIYNYDVPDDQSRTMLTIAPIDEKYYIIEKGQKICLDTDNPNLKQRIFRPFKTQSVVVGIGGIDDREEENVYFHREFDYPYTPEF